MNALLLLLVICLARILSSLLSRINQYVQSIHNELITKEIQMRLMAKSMTIDLEFFDAPDYMDAMQAAINARNPCRFLTRPFADGKAAETAAARQNFLRNLIRSGTA